MLFRGLIRWCKCGALCKRKNPQDPVWQFLADFLSWSRWDAILALAKTASQYAKHESETLIEVIQRRRGEKMDDPATVNAQMGELSQVMGRLIAIGEAYPDLKAASVYQEVMNGVNKYEENVRLSRMVYNDTATKMNRMVRQWPSSIVASILHFATKDYLKVDDEQKKGYPNMDEALKKWDKYDKKLGMINNHEFHEFTRIFIKLFRISQI